MEVDGRGRRKYVAEWIVAVEDERWVNALRNCKPLRVFLAVTGPHSSETPIQRRDQPIHLPLIGFQFAYVKSGPRHRAQSYDMRALEALPQTCPVWARSSEIRRRSSTSKARKYPAWDESSALASPADRVSTVTQVRKRSSYATATGVDRSESRRKPRIANLAR